MIGSAMDTLVESFQLNADYVIRLIASLVLGGLIGIERELRDKPAGFRTIILICVGACVFTVLSEFVGGPDWNTTRIAAQVVTGIGFLGAGAIMRDRATVLGLTTAATIWAVAAIGMAAGFGELGLAAFGTALILVALFALDVIEHWIGDRYDIQEYHIVAPGTPQSVELIAKMFTEAKLQTRKRKWYQEDDTLVFQIVAMGGKANHERLRIKLTRSEEYTLRRA
jgi:putative Mg2+ transporter-C (MgtC) family protein